MTQKAIRKWINCPTCNADTFTMEQVTEQYPLCGTVHTFYIGCSECLESISTYQEVEG